MKIPSEPNETERTGFVHAALQEAARYEAETVAPNDLVADALARSARSGRRYGQTRLIPGLVASTCGVVLLAGAILWPRTPHGLPGEDPAPKALATLSPDKKVALPDLSAPTRFDSVQSALSPIDLGLFAIPAAQPRPRHRIVRHKTHLRRRTPLAPIPPAPIRTAGATGMWRTETVHCEVITRTITPVWVAQADPSTATIVLTPALFQLALQPDDLANPNASPVAATLIPVSFEQENTQP